MISHCSVCKEELDENTGLCPVCNKEPEQDMGESPDSIPTSKLNQDMGKKLLLPFVLGVLWVVVFAQQGIGYMVQGLSYATISYLEGFSAVSSFYNIVALAGFFMLLSAIVIILSCFYIYRLEKYRRANLYYLIGSVLLFIAWLIIYFGIRDITISFVLTGNFYVSYVHILIFGVLGIIFFFLIRKEKDRFHS